MMLLARLLFMFFWFLVFCIGLVTVDKGIMIFAGICEAFLVYRTSRGK